MSSYLGNKGISKTGSGLMRGALGAVELGASPELGMAGIPVGAAGVANLGKSAADLMDAHSFLGASRKFRRTGLPEGPKGDDSDNGRKHGGRAPMHLDLKEGALKKSLHVKEGEKIPEKKLEKAEHSENPLTKKRAVLAETMKHWHHGKKD